MINFDELQYKNSLKRKKLIGVIDIKQNLIEIYLQLLNKYQTPLNIFSLYIKFIYF